MNAQHVIYNNCSFGDRDVSQHMVLSADSGN